MLKAMPEKTGEGRGGLLREEGSEVKNSYTQNDDCSVQITLYKQAADRQDFIYFLRFCAERLSRGETVQEVWRDYQETVVGKLK